MEFNQKAYDNWAGQYDTDQNKTRDLEGVALRYTLQPISSAQVLEIGCGTGKNTGWLIQHAKKVLAVDLSAEMIKRAKSKINAGQIEFVQADITKDWSFTGQKFDLIVFSLVLEHIQDLCFLFQQAAGKLSPGGHLYIGELHPFKQYLGSLARFEKEGGRTELICYQHHVSEFIRLGIDQGFKIIDLNDWFDNPDRSGTPRILTVLFQSP
jgi:2-polyprenyl-3-methyl-5-hydroxy-6-metoxy-1,4-benzoquinol methylase